MRRLWLLAFLVLCIAGCRPSEPHDGKLHLEFWTLSLKPTFTEYVEGMMARYEVQHPNIKLTWLDAPINASMPRLLASIAGGVSPDVVNLNNDFAAILAQRGGLVDMDEAVPADVRAGYYMWDAARYDGHNYAIPWYITPTVVMINSQIFQRAGIQGDPKTWDDIASDARLIHERTEYYGYMPNIRLMDEFQLYNIPIFSADRKHAVFNTPQAVARLQYYVDLFQHDLVPRDTLTRGYQGAIDRYMSGELGILITGPQFLNRVRDNAPTVYAVTRVAPLPESPSGIVQASAMNFVVPRASHHRAEAVDLALFLTNDQNQLDFCKLVTILPSRVGAAHDPFFSQRKPQTIEDQAILFTQKQLPVIRDLSLGLPHTQDLSRAIEEALEGALLGRETAQQALDDACRKWDAILAADAP